MECGTPELEVGTSYTQTSAGCFHTVLLRSDGEAPTCGANEYGQRDVPELEPGQTYAENGAMIMGQLLVDRVADHHTATVRYIATGEALARWTIAEDCVGPACCTAPFPTMALASFA